MFSAFRTSISGLHAASAQVAASASNIVNSGNQIRTSDARTEPATPADRAAELGQAPSPEAFRPVRVAQFSVEPGGVGTKLTEIDPPHVAAFDPASPKADEDGMIALPNVNLENELVNTMIARRAFEANLRVIEAEDEMLGTLLNTKT